MAHHIVPITPDLRALLEMMLRKQDQTASARG